MITCLNCNKKFNINNDLIPDKGRLLQCGSCNHKWFFKKYVIPELIEPIKNENFEIFEPKKIKEKKALDDDIDLNNVDKTSFINNTISEYNMFVYNPGAHILLNGLRFKGINIGPDMERVLCDYIIMFAEAAKIAEWDTDYSTVDTIDSMYFIAKRSADFKRLKNYSCLFKNKYQ